MTKQRIAQIEKAETLNSGFVSTYQRLAEAMDYDAVLVLVPRQPTSVNDEQTPLDNRAENLKPRSSEVAA